MSDFMNLRDYLDVGTTFGGTLLGLGLILLLAPYFPGVSFGTIKIPTFPDDIRARLRWIGPIVFVATVAFHVPFIDRNPRVVTQTTPAPDSSPIPANAPPVDVASPAEKPQNRLENVGLASDGDAGQNEVAVKIVRRREGETPWSAPPLTRLDDESGLVIVTLAITVDSRLLDITPFDYLLEVVLIPDGSEERDEVHLTSYRDNPNYRFVQRADVQRTFWDVDKKIWTDHKGTYVVRVYREGDDGTPRLEATAELTLA